MKRLEQLGRPAALDDVARLFAERVAAADLEGCGPFRDWVEQILVDHPEKKALVLDPGALIEDDLILETDAEPFTDGFSCIVALGDLIVTGRIFNSDVESGPSLLVAGSLKAGDIIKAASAVVVLGSVTVDRLVVCDGDNGVFLVGGNLSGEALIDCDHEILVVGDVTATIASDDLGNMRELLVAEVFEDPEDASNEWPEGDLIRERLLAGLPVLRTTAG
ncbi:MAG: hypothetical protein K2Q28_10295 [Hyphomicrobium sp.]|nr:hypothetical protein [Hyphomicrobium sp.]